MQLAFMVCRLRIVIVRGINSACMFGREFSWRASSSRQVSRGDRGAVMVTTPMSIQKLGLVIFESPGGHPRAPKRHQRPNK